MGDSGAQTSGVQESSTMSDLPMWYKSLTENLGSHMGKQYGGMDTIYNQAMSGGTAPVNGVFNGGATTVPHHDAISPIGASGPYVGQVGSAATSAGAPFGGFGGNGMGTGIGSVTPKKEG